MTDQRPTPLEDLTQWVNELTKEAAANPYLSKSLTALLEAEISIEKNRARARKAHEESGIYMDQADHHLRMIRDQILDRLELHRQRLKDIENRP